MRVRISLFLLILAVARPLQAQSPVTSPRGLSISVFGGGAAFTDFQRASTGSIGAETSPSLAGAVTYWPGRHWGLRVVTAYVPSRFESAPERGAELTLAAAAPSNGPMAGLGIMAYDAQAVFRLPPLQDRMMPYGVVGGGVVRYSARRSDGEIPTEAEDDFQKGSIMRPSATIGIGAMLAMGPDSWSLNFELTDRLSRTPVRSNSEGSVGWTNSLAFMVGVGLRL